MSKHEIVRMLRSSGARVLLVVVVAVTGCRAKADERGADGSWWMSSPSDERNGYLAGYLACELYDAGRTSLREVQWTVLERAISDRYANGTETLSTRVGTLALKLGALQSPPTGGPAGEVHPGKYGVFDGEFWRQSSIPLRLGFVEGYVDCWQGEGIVGARYSKAASEYVSGISRWYGIRPDDESASDDRNSASKVPEVLHRLRDRE